MRARVRTSRRQLDDHWSSCRSATSTTQTINHLRELNRTSASCVLRQDVVLRPVDSCATATRQPSSQGQHRPHRKLTCRKPSSQLRHPDLVPPRPLQQEFLPHRRSTSGGEGRSEAKGEEVDDDNGREEEEARSQKGYREEGSRHKKDGQEARCEEGGAEEAREEGAVAGGQAEEGGPGAQEGCSASGTQEAAGSGMACLCRAEHAEPDSRFAGGDHQGAGLAVQLSGLV